MSRECWSSAVFGSLYAAFSGFSGKPSVDCMNSSRVVSFPQEVHTFEEIYAWILYPQPAEE